jgi:hypothetical protein
MRIKITGSLTLCEIIGRLGGFPALLERVQKGV